MRSLEKSSRSIEKKKPKEKEIFYKLLSKQEGNLLLTGKLLQSSTPQNAYIIIMYCLLKILQIGNLQMLFLVI